jgi:hypothetical protein
MSVLDNPDFDKLKAIRTILLPSLSNSEKSDSDSIFIFRVVMLLFSLADK